MSAPQIIPLEEGWNNEIKAKVGNKTEASAISSGPNTLTPFSFIFQAIDRLENMLDGGMQGKTNMFGPKEYIEIYT